MKRDKWQCNELHLPQNFTIISQALVFQAKGITYYFVCAASSGLFLCWYLRGKFTTDSFMHIPRYCVPCLDVNIALGLPKERNLLSSALFYYLKDSFPIKVTPLILAATRGKERKDACNFRLHLEAPFIFCEAPSSLHSRHYDIIIN